MSTNVHLDIDLGEHGGEYKYRVDSRVYTRDNNHLDKYGEKTTDFNKRKLTILSNTAVNYHDGEDSIMHTLVYAPDVTLDELTSIIRMYVFPANRCGHEYDCCGCSFYGSADVNEIGYGKDMYLIIQSRGTNI